MVNPDSIRLALYGQPFIASAEKFVWATAHLMVRSLFLAGHEQVIVDATNTRKVYRDGWLSDDWDTVFVVFDASPQVCVERALKDGRQDLVDVIHKGFRKYEPPGPGERVVPKSDFL